MDGVDRVQARVHEMERAADLGLPPVGIDLNSQVGAGELGLPNALVLSVAPLIFGAPGQAIGAVRYGFSTFVL